MSLMIRKLNKYKAKVAHKKRKNRQKKGKNKYYNLAQQDPQYKSRKIFKTLIFLNCLIQVIKILKRENPQKK